MSLSSYRRNAYHFNMSKKYVFSWILDIFKAEKWKQTSMKCSRIKEPKFQHKTHFRYTCRQFFNFWKRKIRLNWTPSAELILWGVANKSNQNIIKTPSANVRIIVLSRWRFGPPKRFINSRESSASPNIFASNKKTIPRSC